MNAGAFYRTQSLDRPGQFTFQRARATIKWT
ncbi:hypothetical protein LTSEWAN_1995, partial [Salmonella enterica subsp. enterica serovar Wandsworth str. A4-580]